jgi:hypothetical protein
MKIPLRKSYEDVKCIWMKNGIIEYRLCDNNFECEKCSFNTRIESEIKEQKDNTVNESLHFFYDSLFEKENRTAPFSHPYYHFNNGLILKNFLNNNYYIGFEQYVTNIIDGNCVLSYATDSDFITKGDKLLNIRGNWGSINLFSPVSLVFVERFDLTELITADKRWFGVVEAKKEDIMKSVSTNEFNLDKISRTKSLIREYVVKSSDIAVGQTMYDGGKLETNLLHAIGSGNYENILNFILSL